MVKTKQAPRPKPFCQSENQSGELVPLGVLEHIFAYVSLGLLTGCIHLYFALLPIVIYFIYRGSRLAMACLAVYIILSLHPLSHKPWPAFVHSELFKVWHRYFAYSWQVYAKLEKGKKYFFLEFPHAIFPMGQVLSAAVVKTAFPDDTIMGIAADVVFRFPFFRHIIAWTGTRGASRANILKIFEEGCHCTVLPGGIAEIFVTNHETEDIYFKNRKQIIRIALQEGVQIIPGFFYGNSKIFNPIGGGGSDSFLSSISRKFRASIVFFTGRHGLPVPKRHPLKMVIGPVIPVEHAIPNPTDEQVDELHSQVMEAIATMYEEYKPEWEKRKLVIH
jgi:hypothetical protein